ncbi:MAG: hypothetical protein HYU67_08010 [Flavobacteriia bacterium]|nr:hypothetical protein [Flavobacteriia bacterium]
MRGKKVLWIVFFICSSWIIYYLNFSIADFRLTEPIQFFDKSDQIVWRIRSSNKKLDWSWPQNTKNKLFNKLTSNLLTHSFEIYFSEMNNKVWITDNDFWSESKLLKYFSNLGKWSKIKSHCYRIGKWNFYYYKNKLFISDSALKRKKQSNFKWENIDLMADANKIDYLKHEAEDIYIGKKGINKYIINGNKHQHLNQLSDEELFANNLPATLLNYHFLEKKFALKYFKQNNNSPLSQLVEEGMVFFDWEGDSCLLIDYNKAIDPLQWLQSAEKEGSEQDEYYTETEIGPFFVEGFYAGKVNDKLLITKDINKIGRLEMMFQTGNTLALSKENKLNIYQNLPKKVNQRVFSNKEKFALSVLENSVLKIVDDSKIKIKQIEESSSDFTYIDLGFNADKVFAYKNSIFAIGSQHLALIQNKKILWKKEVIPNPSNQKIKHVFLHEWGNPLVFIQHSTFLEAFDLNGNRTMKIQIPSNQVGSITSYYWSNNSYILYFTSDNILHSIDFKGKTKNITIPLKINHQFKITKVLVENGQIMAVLVFDKSVIKVNLTSGKVINEEEKSIEDVYFLKFQGQYQSIEWRKDGLFHQNKNIITSNYLRNPLIYRLENTNILSIQDSKNIYLFNEKNQIQKIEISSEEIDNYFCLFKNNKIQYIAVLDGIHNKIAVFDQINNKKINELYDGSTAFILFKDYNKTLLISSLGSQLLFYPIQ